MPPQLRQVVRKGQDAGHEHGGVAQLHQRAGSAGGARTQTRQTVHPHNHAFSVNLQPRGLSSIAVPITALGLEGTISTVE